MEWDVHIYRRRRAFTIHMACLWCAIRQYKILPHLSFVWAWVEPYAHPCGTRVRLHFPQCMLIHEQPIDNWRAAWEIRLHLN